MEGRALVTGASGFIGRALTAELLRQGWGVVAVGREAAGMPLGAEAISVARYDDATLGAALRDVRCDVVFHLAAYGVTPSARDPEQMFDVNVAGTAAIVRTAARIGARAVVYAGSSAEYIEAPHGTAITEDYPITTSALYGASKAAGGLWGRAVAAQEGIVFQWLRVFGVFGPGEAPHRLFPAIAAKLTRDEPVDLSPGDQIRDLLYVDDVVAALLLGAKAALEGKAGPFNLCSGLPVSIRDVALALADALGKPRDLLRFGAISYRPDENLWLLGDAARFREATGFRPHFDIAQAALDFISRYEFPQAGVRT